MLQSQNREAKGLEQVNSKEAVESESSMNWSVRDKFFVAERETLRINQ